MSLRDLLSPSLQLAELHRGIALLCNRSIHICMNSLDIETERTETVVATNHGTHRVLHPAVVEVLHRLL